MHLLGKLKEMILREFDDEDDLRFPKRILEFVKQALVIWRWPQVIF